MPLVIIGIIAVILAMVYGSGVVYIEAQSMTELLPLYIIKAAPYIAEFNRLETIYNLPRNLLARVAWQESRFNSAATSPRGAAGMFQFMPATAAEYDIDPRDWKQSAEAAAKYLKKLHALFREQPNPWQHALAAYNWGQGNLARKGIERAPDETVAYYRDISNDVGVV